MTIRAIWLCSFANCIDEPIIAFFTDGANGRGLHIIVLLHSSKERSHTLHIVVRVFRVRNPSISDHVVYDLVRYRVNIGLSFHGLVGMSETCWEPDQAAAWSCRLFRWSGSGTQPDQGWPIDQTGLAYSALLKQVQCAIVRSVCLIIDQAKSALSLRQPVASI